MRRGKHGQQVGHATQFFRILFRSLYASVDLRQFGDRRFDLVLRISVVLQLAAQVLVIRGQITQAMAAEVEENTLLFAFLATTNRLVDGGVDGMGRFGRGDQPFGNREQLSRLKTLQLVERCGGIDFSKPYCLAYSGLSDKLLRKYIADSADLWAEHTEELPICTVGCTIGTHVGPGALAVAFFEK